VTLTLDYRARLLLLVLLLVIAGGVAGVMVVQGLKGSSDDSATPAPVTHPAAPAATKPAAAPHAAVTKKPHAAPAKHRAVQTPAKPKPKHPAAVAAASDQLPVAIRRALAADQVVVVALYDPRAKIDGTALAEARAGAHLAGSAFVPVDVRRHGVDSLNAKYGAVQDPAVLVLRPPDSLVVRIDGFADRDTVAQAAVNAAS
jgi:hypothetical protein